MKNLHQFIIWIQLLKSSPMREDHYDGVNALFRLSAVIDKDPLKGKGQKRQLYELLQNIKTWSVVPNEIVVFTDRIEIHWYAKEYQMVMNQNQYLKLIIQFLFFLSNTQYKNIQFLKRCLMESPDRTVWGAPSGLINYSPVFSSESFGLVGEKIKVLILNEKVEAVA